MRVKRRNMGFADLFATVIAAGVFILVGIVSFMVTVWIIKIGASWAGYKTVEGSTVVLTAGIVTAAALVGSALRR